MKYFKENKSQQYVLVMVPYAFEPSSPEAQEGGSLSLSPVRDMQWDCLKNSELYQISTNIRKYLSLQPTW